MDPLDKLREEVLAAAYGKVLRDAETRRSISPVEAEPPGTEDGPAEELAWALVAVASAILTFASVWFMIGKWR